MIEGSNELQNFEFKLVFEEQDMKLQKHIFIIFKKMFKALKTRGRKGML